MHTTGFHSAANVPVGTTLTRVWFEAVGHYGVTADGKQHDTIVPAIEAGIAYANSARSHDGTPVNPKITVDVRWLLTYPEGGGQNTVAERYTYDSAADAQAHLDRIAKYAPVGA